MKKMYEKTYKILCIYKYYMYIICIYTCLLYVYTYIHTYSATMYNIYIYIYTCAYYDIPGMYMIPHSFKLIPFPHGFWKSRLPVTVTSPVLLPQATLRSSQPRKAKTRCPSKTTVERRKICTAPMPLPAQMPH